MVRIADITFPSAPTTSALQYRRRTQNVGSSPLSKKRADTFGEELLAFSKKWSMIRKAMANEFFASERRTAIENVREVFPHFKELLDDIIDVYMSQLATEDATEDDWNDALKEAFVRHMVDKTMLETNACIEETHLLVDNRRSSSTVGSDSASSRIEVEEEPSEEEFDPVIAEVFGADFTPSRVRSGYSALKHGTEGGGGGCWLVETARELGEEVRDLPASPDFLSRVEKQLESWISGASAVVESTNVVLESALSRVAQFELKLLARLLREEEWEKSQSLLNCLELVVGESEEVHRLRPEKSVEESTTCVFEELDELVEKGSEYLKKHPVSQKDLQSLENEVKKLELQRKTILDDREKAETAVAEFKARLKKMAEERNATEQVLWRQFWSERHTTENKENEEVE